MAEQINDGSGDSQYGWKIDSDNAGYVKLIDSSGNPIKALMRSEEILGSAGTGSDGAVSRVYTLTESNAVEMRMVFLDGTLLRNVTDYALNNTTKKVTMSATQHVYDTQTVTVVYFI